MFVIICDICHRISVYGDGDGYGLNHCLHHESRTVTEREFRTIDFSDDFWGMP